MLYTIVTWNYNELIRFSFKTQTQDTTYQILKGL